MRKKQVGTMQEFMQEMQQVTREKGCNKDSMKLGKILLPTRQQKNMEESMQEKQQGTMQVCMKEKQKGTRQESLREKQKGKRQVSLQ